MLCGRLEAITRPSAHQTRGGFHLSGSAIPSSFPLASSLQHPEAHEKLSLVLLGWIGYS